MARSAVFRDLRRLARIARYCDKCNLTTDQGLTRLAEGAASSGIRAAQEVLAAFA